MQVIFFPPANKSQKYCGKRSDKKQFLFLSYYYLFARMHHIVGVAQTNQEIEIQHCRPHSAGYSGPCSNLTQLTPPDSLPQSNKYIDFSFLVQQNKKFYSVKSSNLFKGSITKENRAKLISWLAKQLTFFFYTRQTFATACSYLDLYLAKSSHINRDSLQYLGIACFFLASKVVERRTPTNISSEAFPREIILNLEKNILLTLQFNVLPLTYVTIAETMLYFLNQYTSTVSNFTYTYFSDSNESLNAHSTFMETLDLLYHIPETLDRDTPSIILAVFFFEHRKNCYSSKHPTTIEEGLQIWEDEDQYQELFRTFVEYLMKKCDIFQKAEIDEDLLCFVIPFLGLFSQKENINKKSYPEFIFPFMAMTYQQQTYSLAKSMLKK